MARPPDFQAALDTLAHALLVQPDLVDSAQSIAFLRGQPHEVLSPLRPRMVCEQSYKPRAEALQAAGYHLREMIEGEHDVLLLLPERQKLQTLADLAHGLSLLKEGGTLVVALHNDWGAKRFEKALASVTGQTAMFSKHHCRVFWTTKTSAVHLPTLQAWSADGALQRVMQGKYWSKPGLFSWDRIDQGSELLARHLPETLAGDIADLGAGWGYLSEQLLMKCHDIRTLDCYEADREALEAARRNLGILPVKVRPRLRWHDVTGGIDRMKYDVVISNPPFHEGRMADPHLGGKFIAAAAAGLRSTGEFWLVANRQLPYEHLLDEAFENQELIVEDNLYKVLLATRPKTWLNASARGKRKDRR
jgi:16S rRNA (guanine1207-N2)-methyltransferase